VNSQRKENYSHLKITLREFAEERKLLTSQEDRNLYLAENYSHLKKTATCISLKAF